MVRLVAKAVGEKSRKKQWSFDKIVLFNKAVAFKTKESHEDGMFQKTY